MASYALRSQVLGSYRALLRAVSATFTGDALALSQMRRQARAAFDAGVGERDAAAIAAKVAEAEEATAFLMTAVAQAKLNESGRYELKLEDKHEHSDTGSGIMVNIPSEVVKRACEGNKPGPNGCADCNCR